MRKETAASFMPDMVNAIWEDRKIITRRTSGLNEINEFPDEWVYRYWAGSPFKDFTDGKGGFDYPRHNFIHRSNSSVREIKCPYGKPGDLLYVREAHYMYGNWIEDEGELTATGKQKWKFIQCKKEVLFTKPEGIEVRGGKNSKDPYALMWHKRLARFMPKSAARIWLEVVSVKVERLNDISPGDAVDEGVEYWNIDGESMEGGELVADFNNYTWTEDKENDPNYADRNFPVFANSVDSFRTLWQSINGTESWYANPWVWAVRFKVISKTGKP